MWIDLVSSQRGVLSRSLTLKVFLGLIRSRPYPNWASGIVARRISTKLLFSRLLSEYHVYFINVAFLTGNHLDLSHMLSTAIIPQLYLFRLLFKGLLSVLKLLILLDLGLVILIIFRPLNRIKRTHLLLLPIILLVSLLCRLSFYEGSLWT